MARSSNTMSSLLGDKKCWRIFFRNSIFPAASLIFIGLFLWSIQHNIENMLMWDFPGKISKVSSCKDQCSLPGSETLPKGIVAQTSNLERRPLWGLPKKTNISKSLFAVSGGIKQKRNVDKMVQKFLKCDFVVMIFHYDGIVDEWKVFNWSSSVIHVSADNQTKWWFAKRFLHPDIVAEYDYIFLWDEDIGVENFHPARYLSIVKDEGFEISQPALDVEKSELHHLITARSGRTKVHRRAYKHDGQGFQCDDKSTGPPCTGWIEVMAPVFSKAAWRCVWYMIQNDLIHAWGLDMRLGYCAQGERTKNIGVVDTEYIVHYGFPTLGEADKAKILTKGKKVLKKVYFLGKIYATNFGINPPQGEKSEYSGIDQRLAVRKQSYNEYKVFRRRWKRAVESDRCWVDPYPEEEHRRQGQPSFWTQT